jgi:hypothetical protein
LEARIAALESDQGDIAAAAAAAVAASALSAAADGAEPFEAEVATMERLRREAPELAYHLLAGISLQVQQNLRQANITIGSLEE